MYVESLSLCDSNSRPPRPSLGQCLPVTLLDHLSGPLLNDRTEIIGVNSFIKEGEGLNYAVAVDVVKEFLQKAENPPLLSTPRPAVPPVQRPGASAERYGPPPQPLRIVSLAKELVAALQEGTILYSQVQACK